MLNLKPIVHIILSEYELPWDGTHGVSHWARVLENGLRLAEKLEPTSKWFNSSPSSMILSESMKAPTTSTGGVVPNLLQTTAAIVQLRTTNSICCMKPVPITRTDDRSRHHDSDLLGFGPPGPWAGWD